MLNGSEDTTQGVKTPPVSTSVVKKAKSEGWECGLCVEIIPWGMFHPCLERRRNEKT